MFLERKKKRKEKEKEEEKKSSPQKDIENNNHHKKGPAGRSDTKKTSFLTLPGHIPGRRKTGKTQNGRAA